MAYMAPMPCGVGGSRLRLGLWQLGVDDVTTLVLVHGTGVRQPAYGAAFDRFAERIAKIRPAMLSPSATGVAHTGHGSTPRRLDPFRCVAPWP